MGSIAGMEDERTKRRPHAVAMPFPAQGHINPMMHFCRALARRGFVVTFVNTVSNQARMRNLQQQQQNQQNQQQQAEEDIRYETVPDNLPVPIADFDIFHQDNRVRYFDAVDRMELQFEELLAGRIAERGPPVSCIIADLFIRWAGDVSRRAGVPSVVFWTATTSSLLIDFHLPQLLQARDVPVEDAASDKLVMCVPGVSPLPVWSLPFVYRKGEAIYDPGFERRITRTLPVQQARWLLINSVQELEPKALQAARCINPNAMTVGPVLLLEEEEVAAAAATRSSSRSAPSLWEESRECLAWLDAQGSSESVLYVSFGSIATLRKEQLEKLADGLEELRQPYLWALRPKAVADMGAAEFDEFSGRVRASGGLLVPWAPQLEVLMHPATGGFLTHCGWNSVLESICGGVPMLCWPCVAEQSLNTKLVVEDWKVGLRFSNVVTRGIVSTHEFVSVVRELMGPSSSKGAELRTNVKALQAVVRSAVAKAGSSQQQLDAFIRSFSPGC